MSLVNIGEPPCDLTGTRLGRPTVPETINGTVSLISSFTHFMVVEEGGLGVLWRLEPFPAVLRRRRGYTQHESAAYRPVTEIDKQPFTINMKLPVGLPVGLSARREAALLL